MQEKSWHSDQNTGSLSSTASTAPTDSLIMGLDDNDQDDLKTPRSIMGLKYAFMAIFMMLIGLSTLQYFINNNHQMINKEYEEILFKAVKARE